MAVDGPRMTPEAATPPAPPRMTTRRAILAQGVADGLSIAEAGRRAGVAHRQSAHEMYNSVREQLPALMDGVGLDVRSILCRIREKCDAHETKFFQFEGKVTERVDVEAHGVQLKALELAVSLRPELAKPEATHIGTVNVLFAGALPDWTVQAGDGSKVVHTGDNGDNAPPPLSAVEGTGVGPGGIAHTNSASVDGDKCNRTVPVETVPAAGVPAKSKLSSRVVKKRVARLPVYRP